jgi:outer membrane protein OmpA-like peptidoglycan-associated protein
MPTPLLRKPLLLMLSLLASCGSPPKPPTVDEAHRRPVNAAMAVELQVCRNDLQNTRLLAIESGRLADSTAATLANITARQQLLAGLQAQRPPAPGNSVFTVRFDFASSRVDIPPEAAQLLIGEAKSAPLVMLRGRTDGLADTPPESRVARERAHAVRDFLVAAGVDPTRIRSTYQPAGDHVADNAGASGKALNRRVEVEIYRTLPMALNADR